MSKADENAGRPGRSRSEAPRAGESDRAWRALLCELLLREHRERRRLAKEMHDGLCQTLNMMMLQLGLAQRRVSGGEARAALDDMEHLIQEAGQSARSVMSELSPAALHVLGLAPALEWLAIEMEDRHGLRVRLEEDGRPDGLGESARVLVYGAVRELLLNVAAHARTDQAIVTLRCEEGRIRLTVQDQGSGLDPLAADAGGKAGLAGVRARIEQLGGRVEIRTAPGEGTAVTLIVPLG